MLWLWVGRWECSRWSSRCAWRAQGRSLLVFHLTIATRCLYTLSIGLGHTTTSHIEALSEFASRLGGCGISGGIARLLLRCIANVQAGMHRDLPGTCQFLFSFALFFDSVASSVGRSTQSCLLASPYVLDALSWAWARLCLGRYVLNRSDYGREKLLGVDRAVEARRSCVQIKQYMIREAEGGESKNTIEDVRDEKKSTFNWKLDCFTLGES